MNSSEIGPRIVTHRGKAHRDEFLALAVVLARRPEVPVFRRDCTALDLADPNTLVIDQGGQLDPALGNFDHHQLDKNAPPTCAFSLVLQAQGLYDIASEVWLWLHHTEVMDSKGPVAWSTMCGTTWDKLQGAMSPIESFVLRQFGALEQLRPGDPMHTFLVELGQDLLAGLEKVTTRLVLLDQVASIVPIKGHDVLDLRAIDRKDQPTLGIETWLKRRFPDVTITITQDDRGDGLSLYRRNDAPGVDFSRLEGLDVIEFVAKTGFIAKTKGMVNPTPLIEKAIA